MLTLPAGLLSSSMPVLDPSASVRRRWPCLLLESILYNPLRLVFAKPKWSRHVCVPTLWFVMWTNLALFETIRHTAPRGLTLPRTRLIQLTPMAEFILKALPLTALELTTAWNRAAPFVLPGLTTFITLPGGRAKSRPLNSSPPLNRPRTPTVLTIPPLRCGLPGTKTLSPLLCLPRLLPSSELHEPK